MKRGLFGYSLYAITLILSSINIGTGLNFRRTDTASSSAYQKYETLDKQESVKQESIKASELKTAQKIINTKIETASIKKTTVKGTVVKSSTGSKHYDYTNKSYINVGVGNVYLREAGNSIAQYRFCQNCKPFLYAHNRSNLFANLAYMKKGDTFSIKVDGKVRKYRVVNNITINLSALNPKPDTKAASNLRASLYKSTYGGNFDITLQTCAGKNDSMRRYIQAVAI